MSTEGAQEMQKACTYKVHTGGRNFPEGFSNKNDGFEKLCRVSHLESVRTEALLQAPWMEEILRGGMMTQDPVCGMRIDEKKAEFQTQFAGKKYSFCSENCKKEFEADPDEFVETAAA